jgi:hypothetical protein
VSEATAERGQVLMVGLEMLCPNFVFALHLTDHELAVSEEFDPTSELLGC